MNSWRPHEVLGGSSAFVWAQLSPLLITLVVIFAYIVYCKVHRYLYPEKYRVQRSSNTTGASGREEAALLHKRVLTLFEIATGAELESKFGVLSSYKNYLFIKGMKFASADGIYSNGFVIVNGKYLVEANDLWAILLMKLLRKRYTNVYVYEITGSTVQQTAKLVYPHTFTLTDLWYLNVKVLS
uniref:Uncharacterized protein n=1 Tax=Globisporangium ultimum (strain ATCC 200006 / CBS 805.95 / DAOM BR144) TaxID=431595 RepID=K3W8J3_GLOUD